MFFFFYCARVILSKSWFFVAQDHHIHVSSLRLDFVLCWLSPHRVHIVGWGEGKQSKQNWPKKTKNRKHLLFSTLWHSERQGDNFQMRNLMFLVWLNKSGRLVPTGSEWGSTRDCTVHVGRPVIATDVPIRNMEKTGGKIKERHGQRKNRWLTRAWMLEWGRSTGNMSKGPVRMVKA